MPEPAAEANKQLEGKGDPEEVVGNLAGGDGAAHQACTSVGDVQADDGGNDVVGGGDQAEALPEGPGSEGGGRASGSEWAA